MKALTILLSTMALSLVACGPDANFSFNDNGVDLQALNGESVEVVTDEVYLEEMDQISQRDDNGLNPGDDSTQAGDDGINRGDDPVDDGKHSNDEKDCKDKKKHRRGVAVKDKEIRPHAGKQKELISIDDLQQLPDVLEAMTCHKKGKMHKFSFCHHPAGDYDKRKTLCLPMVAINNRLKVQRHNYLGACQ
jgi:hypothetical protein